MIIQIEINPTKKHLILLKINKIDRSLARLTKKKQKTYNLPLWGIKQAITIFIDI